VLSGREFGGGCTVAAVDEVGRCSRDRPRVDLTLFFVFFTYNRPAAALLLLSASDFYHAAIFAIHILI